MNTCSKCNHINKVDAQFCMACGNLFVSEETLWKAFSLGVMDITILKDRYAALELIKSGGMGKIFMGLDRNLGKVCAIKELLQNIAGGGMDPKQAREMFEQEAKLLASLNHQSLPRVYDYFILDDKCYLIMDYIVGDDLLKVIEEDYEDGCPEDQVLKWGVELCDVLAYLHNRKPPIIYRDLKPDNIMLKRNDNILYLIDFGIAKASAEDKKDNKSETTFASFGYASPEQCAGRTCDARSDIYSLGCTLYHLFTGFRPKGFTMQSLKDIRHELSLYTDNVIKKSTSMKPQERYQTVEEFRYALQMWLDPFSLVEQNKSLDDIDLLILQLKAREPRTRISAIKALCNFKDPKVTASLIKMLQDEEIAVQKNAAYALGEIGDYIAIDSLIQLFRSKNEKIYKPVVDSLAKIRWTASGDLAYLMLKDFFSHSDGTVRFFAYNQQLKFKNRAFYYHLLEGLQDSEGGIRKISALGLAEIGHPDALPYIKKALEKEGFFNFAMKSAMQKAIQILEDILASGQPVEPLPAPLRKEELPDTVDFSTGTLKSLDTASLRKTSEVIISEGGEQAVEPEQEQKSSREMDMDRQLKLEEEVEKKIMDAKAKPSQSSSRRILGFNEGHLDMLKDEIEPPKLKLLEENFLHKTYSEKYLKVKLVELNFTGKDIQVVLDCASGDKAFLARKRPVRSDGLSGPDLDTEGVSGKASTMPARMVKKMPSVKEKGKFELKRARPVIEEETPKLKKHKKTQDKPAEVKQKAPETEDKGEKITLTLEVAVEGDNVDKSKVVKEIKSRLDRKPEPERGDRPEGKEEDFSTRRLTKADLKKEEKAITEDVPFPKKVPEIEMPDKEKAPEKPEVPDSRPEASGILKVGKSLWEKAKDFVVEKPKIVEVKERSGISRSRIDTSKVAAGEALSFLEKKEAVPRSKTKEEQKRMEQYKALMALGPSGKKSSKSKKEDSVTDLKKQLEEERKALEEKKKMEMEKRKELLEGGDRETKEKLLQAKDDLKSDLEREKKLLILKQQKEQERREKIISAAPEENLNCWEFMKCGKERFCPAFPTKGKKCACVVGNLGGRTPRGPLAGSKNCAECRYFNSNHYSGPRE